MTDDSSKTRRELLDQLKARRQDGIERIASRSISPEKTVLVPASSSPIAPSRPTTSKFFNGGMSANGSMSGRQPMPPGSRIPSSRLGAPAASSSAGGAGTPASIMDAIANRKTAADKPRAPGQSSLAYDTASTSTTPVQPSRPNTSHSTLLDSPSSPQPLSRLKKKYTEDSPAKLPSSSPDPLRLKPIARSGSSLIAAAKQADQSEQSEMLQNLCARFKNLKQYQISQIIARHKTDVDRAVAELLYMDNQAKPSVHRTSSSTSFSSSTHPTYPSSPMTAHTHTSSNTIRPHVSSPAPAHSSAVKANKPKNNEKSRIYANRENGHKSKRRDPDESESEAEAQGSDGDSENDWSGDDGGRKKKKRRMNDDEDDVDAEGAALKAFNEATVDVLTGTIACSEEQANKIISLRPFEDLDDVRVKLGKAKGVSMKLFEQYTEIMEGYVQIDACLNRCARIADDVASTLAIWRGASIISDSVVGTPRSDGLNDVKVDVSKVSELLKQETDAKRRKVLSQYIQTQPSTLSKGTILKDYQLLGINWLNLLWSKKIGCILADEMGLGKTIQVIAFLAHLKEQGVKGPHMIFVPASTLENWIREFDKFAPEIDVQTYYGTQAERAGLRSDLKRKFRSGKLEVVLASYTQVTSADDLSFFRKKIDFLTCIYDEGHRLKSCTTKAYVDLMSIKPKWRLLLTGTPLQNNLQELVSLLMFIHKDTFTDAEPYLRAIFKSQGHASLLSQQRVSRARTMLTPFVLRRRKAHVLDLPPKIETVQHCDMTPVQAKLYRETMNKGKKVLEELDDAALEEAALEDEADGAKGLAKKATKKTAADKKKVMLSSGNSSHILMDLRKAASHPLLFRRHYTDAKVKKIAKECLNTPVWCDSNFDYVVEDLEVMSDAEISHLCRESEFDNLRKFALDPSVYLEGGKVAALQAHIERCKKEGKRMLLFSQFVMILDILQVALDHLNVQYTRLDGGTKTDERQAIVDEFTEDPDITVFLLSTKAGGVGINLVAASVVVIYDQDFNPHNDRQAADRAYRIGQDKEVEVIKLITKDSIDEDMLAIGDTKLQLDDAVGGEEITLDGEAGGAAQKEDKTAKEVRKSLLTTLRNKFDAGKAPPADHEVIEIKDEDDPPVRKIARAAPRQAA